MYDKNYDDSWDLIDPITKKVVETVSAKELWTEILELRAGAGRGEPFIMFIDNVNNNLPEAYVKHGMKVRQSNICTEILNYTDDDNTFVCCLASHNLEYYDEYKDNHQYFRDVTEMLDNVLQYFIDYAPEEIHRAINAAVNERNIGVGVMGFHSYLQSKHIPFECAMAKSINNNIFKNIRSHLDLVNLELGSERGSPKLLEGTGKRFVHMMALAPTASNSLICGNTSPSIEPWRANAFRQDTLSGSYTQKNKFLDKFLKEWQEFHGLKEEWIAEQWQEVVNAAGSVTTLKWMLQDDKDVFKTAAEIDNMWIIEHAADRQKNIDQTQSLNIFIQPTITIARLHAIHYAAWKKGVKTMYYCRSEKLHNTSVSSKVLREKLEDDINLMKTVAMDEDCIACQG
jgi:ribonucleoside-diphosphate reductase alpha chain